MAFKYEDLIIDKGQELQARRAEAMADFEAGRQTEDIVRCREAEDRILQIDRDYEQLERYANQFVARQQQVPHGNQFGLSPDEVEIANNMFGPIKDRSGNYVDLSNEQKQKLYFDKKNEYRYKLATGQYSKQSQ
jgi:hypothetical protein